MTYIPRISAGKESHFLSAAPRSPAPGPLRPRRLGIHRLENTVTANLLPPSLPSRQPSRRNFTQQRGVYFKREARGGDVTRKQ